MTFDVCQSESFEGKIPSEKAIKCLRKAIMRLPDLNEVSIVLAESLYNRFNITAWDEDCQEGMAIVDKVITFHDAGDGLSPYLERAVELAAMFAYTRFEVYGRPEHLEQAIHRFRTFLDRAPLEESNRALPSKLLSYLEGLRLNASDITVDVEDLLSFPFKSTELPSFRDLIASLPELNDIRTPEEGLGRHRNALRDTTIDRLTDIVDINDSIKYCRHLLTSYTHSGLAVNARSALCGLFLRAFECTNQVEYLDEGISAARENIGNLGPLMDSDPTLLGLASLLSTRFNLLHRREDLDESMRLFAMAANHEHAGVFHDSSISCQWASIAHRFGHPSASTAYDRAMSSMQASLTFSPTLDIQHSRLIAMGDKFKTLPLDYTSYQIRTGRLKRAIEILERGRALLWSEMRGLRTSIDHIRLADPHLADKFAAVNQDLETLTLPLNK